MTYQKSTKQHKDKLWEKQKNSYPWDGAIDYRQNPESYRVGKGEQGVLICQPYKSEILAHWRFKNPEVATESSEKIYALFEDYLKKDEFVGADMARKYLQMGYTRARRYANHKGGRKYNPDTGKELPLNVNAPEKEESADIFYKKWREAEDHSIYKVQKKEWKEKFG